MVNELYRQAIHLGGGLAAAIGAFVLPNSVFLLLAGLCILTWLALILLFTDRFTWLFNLLERENVSFKGKGALFFGLGCFVTGLFFWEQAGWALLVLAVPDSAATIVGKMYRSPKLPYNHRKTLLGSAAFFASAIIILSVRFPFVGVLLLAFLLTALESFDYREIPFLDDNIVVPLVAAYLLSFV